MRFGYSINTLEITGTECGISSQLLDTQTYY